MSFLEEPVDAFKRQLDFDVPSRRPRRFFTPSDANRSLVLVRRIVSDILAEYARLGDLLETLEAARQGGRCDLTQSVRANLTSAVESIGELAEELRDVGVELRDWTLGIVDFPCIVDRREVALCWQAGEQEVGFWHGAGDQCSERQSIEMLPTAETLAAYGL